MLIPVSPFLTFSLHLIPEYNCSMYQHEFLCSSTVLSTVWFGQHIPLMYATFIYCVGWRISFLLYL